MNSFGDKLRELRRRAGYTQRQLGVRAELDATYISKLEHGADRPGEAAVRRLADALSTDVDDLLLLAGRANADLDRETMSDPRVGGLLRRLPRMGASQRSAVFRAGGIGTKSILLVDATDLDQWADRRDAQALLPLVIQRLVLATATGIRRAQFRGGEGISLAGWDGLVDVGEGNAFVPAGVSGWEVGTSARPRAKADSDFEKRTANPGSVAPAEATFVFVTPKRFPDKEAWEAERRGASAWHGIRVIDADDLAAWLTLAPAVHTWLSIELGKMPDGIRTLETTWREWSEACSPALSVDVTLAGRLEAAEALGQVLQSQAGVHLVRGDSAQEALAFVASVIKTMSPEAQSELFARAVVCDKPEAWQRLSTIAGPLILITTFVPADAAVAAAGGKLVLVVGGRDLVGTETIDLPRPGREPLRSALAEMLGSLGEDERTRRVEELATVGRRSLLALRRKLAISPALSVPPWAGPERVRQLIPIMLAGGWQEDREGDRLALEKLADRPYREILADCVWLSTRQDPPLRRDGSSWILVSKEDLWMLIAHLLTTSDAASLERAVKDILGAADPAQSMPRSERWMANVRGFARPHSELLRRGIADSVLMMAAPPAPVTGLDGRALADGIVARLLGDANSNPGGSLWASLGDVLPALAEAAPERFLEAVDRGLVGDSPVLARLFPTGEDEGVFGPAPDTTGLLWALETLAWHPSHLGGAAVCLARLDRLDPGVGKWTNRPLDSLRRIFLPWHPSTNADPRQRLQIIDAIRRREPTAAWKLMVGLLPKLHDFASPTHEPARRDWRLTTQAAATWAEVFESADNLTARLVEDAGTVPERWIELIEALRSLPPSARELVLGRLEETDFGDSEGDRTLLGEHLRSTVAQHRAAREAVWRLPDGELDRMESVSERLASRDPVRSVAWLFSTHPQLAVPLGEWDAYQSELKKRRADAVASLHAGQGLAAIRSLAEGVVDPFSVGFALAEIALSDADDEELVEMIRSPEPALKGVGAGYAVGRYWQDGWAWTHSTVERLRTDWRPSEIAEMLVRFRPTRALWDLVTGLGADTQDAYWRAVPARLIAEPAEVDYAVDALLGVDRGVEAVDLLSLNIERLRHPDSERLVAAALLSSARDSAIERADVGMFAWAVTRLLDFLVWVPAIAVAQ
jgi:transcriptional regulator with XRE-family HTH domain